MTTVIDRVRQLTIKGFRGFVGETSKDLNTDTDIVLLVGANGHGKSSFLEALLLVVTGAVLPDREPLSLFSRVQRENGEWTEVETFRIEATCAGTTDRGRDDQPDLSTISRVVSAKRTTPAVLEVHIDPSEEREAAEANPWASEAKLRARLTAFFQDNVELLFDDVAHGRTLLDIVYPIPVLARAIANGLTERAERCRRDVDAARPPDDEARRAEDERTFADWVDDLRPVLDAARTLRAAWPTLPTGASALEWRNAIRAIFATDRRSFDGGANLPRQVVKWLVDSYPDWLKDAEDLARASLNDEDVRRLARERKSVESELSALNRDHPRFDEDMGAFAGSGGDERTALPSLLEVLTALQQHRARWIADARQRLPTFTELANELEAIDPAKLAAQTLALAHWQEQRMLVRDRRESLRRTLAEMTDRLRRATPETDALRALRAVEPRLATLKNSEPWRKVHEWLLWDEDQELRERRKVHLRGLAAELTALAARVEARGSEVVPSLEALRAALNQVAHRFKLGSGALPIRVDPAEVDGSRQARLTFDDGRDLGHFSSGQRSQVAVAFMVAQNQLVQNSEAEVAGVLPHRILILDDVATTYDLSNLAAETLLWRQLAYTRDPDLQRQIFISSHHEDLTNQLIDLLAPPGSSDPTRPYSMRILRFTDWNAKDGPTIVQQKVRPTAATPSRTSDTELLRAELEAVLYEGST